MPGSSILTGDALTWLVTLLALVVVWVPFWRGMRLTLQAWSATRTLDKSQLSRAVAGESKDEIEPLAALMLRVLKKSLDSRESSPDFVLDATRQYVMNEFDTFYSKPIAMFASLLPPIGFIGTTVGMLILFVSMHQSNASLELSALAVALSSSIFALIAFAVLEGLKIRLYSRLLVAVRAVEALYADADAQRSGKQAAPKSKGLASAPA